MRRETIEEEAEHSYPGTLPDFRQETETEWRAVGKEVVCDTFKLVCGPYADTFHKWTDVPNDMFLQKV